MNPIIIENDFIRVTAQTKGAELHSIYNKQTAIEYLWQAGEAWPKQAPVLFPIVGQLKNNTYQYHHHTYAMPRHGFARDKNFTLLEKSGDKMVFVLQEDTETLQQYPFCFLLRITYFIRQQTLQVSYEVINSSEEVMYFSIGAHPAFKVPLLGQEYYSDYYLEFNKKETSSRWLLQDGLLTEPVAYLENQSVLPLSHSLFRQDALILKGLKSDMISLRCKKSEHGIHFRIKDFPYLGLWSSNDANFVCIEPWYGIADSINSDGQLENKEGIIPLKKNHTFYCEYSLETF